MSLFAKALSAGYKAVYDRKKMQAPMGTILSPFSEFEKPILIRYMSELQRNLARSRSLPALECLRARRQRDSIPKAQDQKRE
jgi:hypothetical protein